MAIMAKLANELFGAALVVNPFASAAVAQARQNLSEAHEKLCQRLDDVEQCGGIDLEITDSPHDLRL